jgi:hypothetical protein
MDVFSQGTRTSKAIPTNATHKENEVIDKA